MPKVVVKGHVRHFPYTSKGKEEAMKAERKEHKRKKLGTSDGYMLK